MARSALICSSSVLLMLLLAWLSSSIPSASADAPPSFDYFYLVRQWPATFCNDHNCRHSPPRE